MSSSSQKFRGPLIFILGVAVLLALYAVSMGPAARMACRFSNQVMPRIYSPLIATCKVSPSFGRSMAWYVNKWLPDGAIFSADGRINSFSADLDLPFRTGGSFTSAVPDFGGYSTDE